MELKKVLQRSDKVKYIIIPKKSDLEAGDYVTITKMEENNDRTKNTK